MTRLVTVDEFPPVAWLRDWVLYRWPSGDTDYSAAFESEDGPVNKAGRRVTQYGDTWIPLKTSWVGELVTCAWCSSAWVAVVVVVMRANVEWWPWVALPLAFSAVAGILSRHD